MVRYDGGLSKSLVYSLGGLPDLEFGACSGKPFAQAKPETLDFNVMAL